MATIVTTCLTPLTSIDGNDCIGDTRIFLNNNFLNLSNGLCNLYTSVSALTGTLDNRITALSAFVKSLSAKDSSTIDLFFNANSYILSADVINSSLGTIKLGQDVTTFGKHLLTSTNIPLSSLAGVQLTSTPTVGHVLKWNGQFWTNGPDSGALSGMLVDRDYGDIIVSNNTLVWTIDNDAISESKILNLNVTENKISPGAVTTSKLASAAGFEAVVTQTIRDNAVTTAKISAQAITEPKIAANAIITSKILDNNVTNAKLATVPAYSIKGNSTSSTATPTDIQATANTVLRYTSTGSFGFGQVPNEATTGTSNLVSNTLVLRDTNGNFSAGVVTASAAAFGFIGNLQGTALSANRASLADLANEATKLQTARRIELSGAIAGSANFDGTSTATLNTILGSELQNLLSLVSSLTSQHIGSVVAFATSTTPTGWLVCNGDIIQPSGSVQGVDASLLQTLRGRLGTTYGVLGQLPDLRGQFVRGWDNGRNIDPGRAFGTDQADAFASHFHSYADRYLGGSGPNSYTGAGTQSGGHFQTFNTGSQGGTETRPKNIAMLYCIKY